MKATFRETFQAKPEALAIIDKEFERRAGAISENEERAGERVLIEACFAERDKRVDPLALSLVIILTFNNVYNVRLYSRFVLCRIFNSSYFYNVVKLLNEGSKSNDSGARKYLLARCR